MLRELGIRNFVLIDTLRLEWDEGLNVLTGETGAGKSIILDAIGLLLGDRFKADQVRQGADRSEIDGVFDAPRHTSFRRWWEEHGYDKADELLIRREGSPDGRSRAFLNDRPVTLNTLEELAAFLVDVHGQNEHQQILKPAVQLAALDRFAELEDECAAIEPLYRAWESLTQDLHKGQLSEQERMQRIDLYKYQLDEIASAKLKAGEDEELAARLPELKNAEKLRVLGQAAYGALYEDEGAVVERLGQVERSLTALQAMASSVEPLTQQLQAARAQLEEISHALQSLLERWGTDPEALEAAITRQDTLARLGRKYGGSAAAILAHAEQLKEQLFSLENAEVYRQDLEKRIAEARRALEKAAKMLSEKRKAAAKKLGTAVQKELKDLGLAQAVFRVTVETMPNFSTTGVDRVVFEWAPNPGEGIQPLKAIASGGEMSRVMLALKTVLAHADAIPTLVFDEIDAGIGGLTAQAVGKKLRALSRHHQILCVSHLPQIASSAHAHFTVAKRVIKSRTIADVIRLEPSERLNELARLLGSQVTPTSVQHAKELLSQNQ